MSVFGDLAALPFGETYVAATLMARVRSTGEIRTLYVTDAPKLFTEPTEDPPSQHFQSVILKGWRTFRSLTEGKSFSGPSRFSTGSLIFDNSPETNPFAGKIGAGKGGPFDDWLDLDWNGQSQVLKAGGRIKADGSPFPHSEYETFFTGIGDEMVPRADGTLELKLRGEKGLLDDPVVTERYKAFGGAVLIPADTRLQSDFGSQFSFSDLTAELFGVVSEYPTLSTNLLDHSTSNYGIAINNAGALAILHESAFFSSYVTALGDPLVAAVTYESQGDGNTVAILYAGKDASDFSERLRITIPDFVTADGRFRLGDLVTPSFGIVEIWEVRVSDAAQSLEVLRGRAGGPLSSPETTGGLVEAWKMDDGEGSVAMGEKGAADLMTSGGSVSWVTSGEGDDPERGGDLLGKTKPDGFGAVFNAALTPIDEQRSLYEWKIGPSFDITRAKSNGTPLVPDETIPCVLLGDIAFDDTDDAFVLTAGQTAKRLIPGQTKPAAEGQRIELTDAGAFDGVYLIAPEGINEAADRIIVLDEFGVPVTLSSGDLPALSIFKTLPAEIQFTYDLATSRIDTPQPLAGFATVDAVLTMEAPTSEVFEAFVGEAPTNLLTFDPVVSVFWDTDQGDQKGRDFLDELMNSVFGWWVENRGGGFTIGNHAAPTGDPVAALLGSKASTISATTVLPPIVEAISRIVGIPSTGPPHHELVAGYGRTWHVAGHGTTTPVVPPAVARTLENPYRKATKPYPQTKKDFPTSQPSPMIRTLIVNRQDAEAFLDVAAPLLTVRRRWFDVVVGLGALAIDLHDVVLIEHPEGAHSLQTPTLARVMSMDEDTTSDRVEIGLYV